MFNHEDFVNIGNALWEKNECEEVIIAYEIAQKLNLKNAENYNNKGNTLYGQKDYEKAIESYIMSIELNLLLL